jgi:glycosyltransferase involved in cell wall biosynthesis
MDSDYIEPKMKIGLDIRPLLKEATGVGVYWKNLLSSLAAIDDSNEYHLFSCSLKDRFDLTTVPRFQNQTFKDLRFPQKWLNALWARWGRPSMDRIFHTDLDITHSPSPLVCPTRGKRIITVHDLFFVEHPGFADEEARKLFLPNLERTLQQTDAVVAVSAHVKKKLMEIFSLPGRKISVIHHGVEMDFFHPRDEEKDALIWAKYGLTPGYIFFIGAGEPRKNIPRLLEAFDIVSREIPDAELVLAGKSGGDTPVIQRKMRHKRIADRIKLLSYIPRKEVPALYRGAGLFVFPSLCEGFGLPLLEAMASHIPVAASRAPAIPEIAGKAALYFDPVSPADMAQAIQQGLQDEKLRENLKEAGEKRIGEFSWKQAAALTYALYTETAGLTQ